MTDNNEQKDNPAQQVNENTGIEETVKAAESDIDENMHLFLFGNIKIRDVDTDEILVNKRF